MKRYKTIFNENDKLFYSGQNVQIIKNGKWKNYYGVITSFSGNKYYVTIQEDPTGEPLTNAPRDVIFFGKDLVKDV